MTDTKGISKYDHEIRIKAQKQSKRNKYNLNYYYMADINILVDV